MALSSVNEYRGIWGTYTQNETTMLTSHICRPNELVLWESENIVSASKAFCCGRKKWEFGYAVKALHERGKLHEGAKGLGFACGKEPLPSLFANYGCHITATDAPFDNDDWGATGQKSNNKADLFYDDIVEKNIFDKNVNFEYADMNFIPKHFEGKFDFIWSSCALEHLGTLHEAKNFVYEAMRCLKPNGIAVHTTEINLRFQFESFLMNTHVIPLRSIDFIEIAEFLTKKGHKVAPLDFRLDDSNLYANSADLNSTEGIFHPHFIVKMARYTLTSFGLIIQKKESLT